MALWLPRTHSEAEISKARITRILLTVVSLGLVAAHVLGKITLDLATSVLLVIAALPWLGELFQSLEFPGGWKVGFRDLQQRVTDAEGNSQQAVGTAESAERRSELALAGPVLGPSGAKLDPLEDLQNLSTDYDQVRNGERGAERTDRMNSIFRSMLDICRSAPGSTRQVWPGWLGSDSGGLRLAAYASLYVDPDAAASETLTSHLLSVTNTKKRQAFGEYWAIVCLSRILETSSPQLRNDLSGDLHELLKRFPEGTDRHSELVRSMRHLGLYER